MSWHIEDRFPKMKGLTLGGIEIGQLPYMQRPPPYTGGGVSGIGISGYISLYRRGWSGIGVYAALIYMQRPPPYTGGGGSGIDF